MNTKEYSQNGYQISSSQILNNEKIISLTHGSEAILSGIHDTGIPPTSRYSRGEKFEEVIKFDNPHFSSKAIKSLCTDRKLSSFIRHATGYREIQVWWSQLVVKSPMIDSIKPESHIDYHQESTYERDWSDESALFTCWIPLTDIGISSGGLKYVTRSHLLGPQFNNIKHGDIDEAIKSWSHLGCYVFDVLIPKGFVAIHDRNLYHGSGPNMSDSSRIGIALHCIGDNNFSIKKNTMFTENIYDYEKCPYFI